MKTRLRIRGAITLTAAACVWGAFGVSEAKELTLDDRVAAQRAIEQVYWSHRSWPSVNAAQKPPLSAVLPDGAIRGRVEASLRASMLLDSYWRQPLTGDDLQSELDRIAGNTTAPETLRELFAALHDDPFLIAECLVRPALAERRAREAFATDERIHGAQRVALTSAVDGLADIRALSTLSARVAETTFVRDDHPGEIAVPGDFSIRLAPADWSREVDQLAAALPAGRTARLIDEGDRFTAVGVRSQDETHVTIAAASWPKRDFDEFAIAAVGATPLVTSAIAPPAEGYALRLPAVSACVDDTWSATQVSGSPFARYLHSAVWTGAEMIVWGGYSVIGTTNQGGRYVPATNTWVPTSVGANVPFARYQHSAVWTGTEMIVWGGWGAGGLQRSGGRYDPTTDAWVASSLAAGTGANVPPATADHVAVWTGTEMIVWGGQQDASPYMANTGGRYNPVTDSWAATSLTTGSGANVPEPREAHSGVWTGSELIVWGGFAHPGGLSRTGGRYNPATDSWAASQLTSGAGAYAPSARWFHTAVWSGTEMIVWGGGSVFGYSNTGGRYDPLTDSWAASSLTLASGPNFPHGRWNHTAVWTGDEMVVWGGAWWDGMQYQYFATGGRYNPSTDTWSDSSLLTGSGINTPSDRDKATSVWTGPDRRMIVWGGNPSNPVGGLYCAQPCTPLTWYQDADGDGHGNPAAPTSACLRPAGYAAAPDDCDDAAAVTYPGAPEFCDGLDNDCDPATPLDESSPSLCDDANACTDQACGGINGCQYTNNTALCDDGDPCSANDACVAGICRGAPISDVPCEDGNACTLGDMCQSGFCQPGPGHLVCDDNSVCTADRCEPRTGCVFDSSQLGDLCDDGIACTVNACDPVDFCVFPPSPAGSGCDDFDACTGPDLCDGQGGCVTGPPLDCDDHNPCTDDACDVALGCTHVNNSASCDDGNLCSTGDRCLAGACRPTSFVFCYPTDGCHDYGTCNPQTGACVNPVYPDGTFCDDGDLCTRGETCQAGACTPALNGLENPDPKTSGYYIQLCEKADAGQLPWHGDYLTDEDAYCVGALTVTFNYFYWVGNICDVIHRGHHGGEHHGGPGNGPDGNACDKGENELIATALNLCRARLCEQQRIDSQCHGNVGTTVAASFTDADAILDSADRTATTCRDAVCELREINTGHALEMTSLTLAREAGGVRLAWLAPVFDDGTGAAAGYEIWRRPLRSSHPFTRIDTTAGESYLDTAGAADSWEYAVTAVIASPGG